MIGHDLRLLTKRLWLKAPSAGLRRAVAKHCARDDKEHEGSTWTDSARPSDECVASLTHRTMLQCVVRRLHASPLSEQRVAVAITPCVAVVESWALN
jgi:hypothetical protein